MNNKENGGPAFPFDELSQFDGKVCAQYLGMSLRDYFAAHAPNPPDIWHGGDRNVSDIIQWRWRYADEMLKARET